MLKVPFELMVGEANSLIQKMATCKDPALSLYWYDQFQLFLKTTGWTEKEFDIALLQLVDSNWNRIYSKSFLN